MIVGSGATGLKMHDYLCTNNIHVEAFIDIDQKLIGRTRRAKTIHVISEETANNEINSFISMGDSILISAISARNIRQKIRQYLHSLGLSETDDFIIAA